MIHNKNLITTEITYKQTIEEFCLSDTPFYEYTLINGRWDIEIFRERGCEVTTKDLKYDKLYCQLRYGGKQHILENRQYDYFFLCHDGMVAKSNKKIPYHEKLRIKPATRIELEKLLKSGLYYDQATELLLL